jgi:hypothetical protein
MEETMSEENDGIIQRTLDKVNKTLYESYEFFDRIEKLGLIYQEKGQKLVRYARMGKQYIDYQISEAPKLAIASKDYPLFLESLADWNISGEKINSWLNEAEKDLSKGIENADTALYSISSGTSTASADVNSTVTDITFIQNREDKNLYKTYDFQNPDFLNRREIITELDYELEQIEKGLSSKRKGAWETFNSVSKDKKSQAANSMREILRKITSMWASNDDVKTAHWWKYEKDTDDGVSQKHRIRFLLFGLEDEVEDYILESIEKQVKRTYESTQVLNATAHGSDKSTELVEATMKLIEDTLYRMIIFRKQYL